MEVFRFTSKDKLYTVKLYTTCEVYPYKKPKQNIKNCIKILPNTSRYKIY
jgi:hypothetical protein